MASESCFSNFDEESFEVLFEVLCVSFNVSGWAVIYAFLFDVLCVSFNGSVWAVIRAVLFDVLCVSFNVSGWAVIHAFLFMSFIRFRELYLRLATFF